jgi:hypothetical protein
MGLSDMNKESSHSGLYEDNIKVEADWRFEVYMSEAKAPNGN